MPARRPEPPASGIAPLFEPWPRDKLLMRAYRASSGRVTAFNATASTGRFRPIYSGPPGNRVPVPTIYAAADTETALAEGLLRGVDAGGARVRLYVKQVEGIALAGLVALRDLRLVRLHGAGLKRLRLLRTELVDSEAEAYAWTASWAQAIHDQVPSADGLVWTSRQNDSARAMILWGDRVATADLDGAGPVTPLDREPGIDLVRQACLDADIDFEG
jgi:hypothetical protein